MFFSLPNLSSVLPVQIPEPWAVNSRIPDNVKSKRQLVQWRKDESTNHVFLTAYEGANPHSRITDQNKPVKQYAAIVDYDATMTGNDDSALIDKLINVPPDLRPSWLCSTFNHGRRLVYLFSEPISFLTPEIHSAFLRQFSQLLELPTLFPGFDQAAWDNWRKYFELGTDWKSIGGSVPIPATRISGIMAEAGDRANWKEQDLDNIPIEQIAEEIHRKYPGKWKGNFTIGTRGIRFWDDSATDHSAAIVRETGMQYFSDGGGFRSWKQLLGQQFVAKFHADKIGTAINGIYYDQKTYWRKSPQGIWVGMTQKDTLLYLRQRHEIIESEETDLALQTVHDTKLITGVAPVLFRKEIIDTPRGPLLNTSTVKPLSPSAETDVDPIFHFPWITQLLEGLFDDHRDEYGDQCDYFCAWLQRFYVTAYNGSPRSGQALFICGPVNVGKTLLITGIVSRLMGGYSDASKFLMGETNNNGAIVASPIALIDDTEMIDDIRKKNTFSSTLKRTVVSGTILSQDKYIKAQDVPWHGRIVVTHNNDSESKRVLPDGDTSVLDKVMYLNCRETIKTFPDKGIIEDILEKELPYFARWLMEVQFTNIVLQSRMGMRTFHHPEMLQDAKVQSRGSRIVEIIEIFRAAYFTENPKESKWEGTITKFRQYLGSDQGNSAILNEWNSNSLSRALAKLTLEDAGVEQHVRNNTKVFIIGKLFGVNVSI